MSEEKIAQAAKCKRSTAGRWKRLPQPIMLQRRNAEKLIGLLDRWAKDPGQVMAEPGDSTSTQLSEPAERKDHVYMIPEFNKQVVLIDLINQELNQMSAERLSSVYRAIMKQII